MKNVATYNTFGFNGIGDDFVGGDDFVKFRIGDS